MEIQSITKLESAARVILALPSTVSQTDRSEAELVFIEFRKSKSPYNICKYIFENCKIDYVAFEAANTLKDAVIREWNLLRKDDISALWQYLLHHVLNNPSMAVFVREKMFQVIAIIIKKGSITDAEERSKLLADVEQFILSGDLHKQLVGCGLISAMLQEYAVNIKSSNIGLTLRVHLLAKKEIETSDLRTIFKLCIKILSDIAQIDGQLSENVQTVLKSLLCILELILSWSFVSLRVLRRVCSISDEIDSSQPLSLTADWKEFVENSQIIEMFFYLHCKIRNHANLTHYTLNCLVKLASLRGPVLYDVQIRKQYISSYMHCFITFVSNNSILDREAYGLSCIVENLSIHEKIIFAEEIPFDICVNYTTQFCNLMCLFIEKSACNNSVSYDSTLYDEAFNNMAKVWNKILMILSKLEAKKFVAENYSKNIYLTIFKTFLKWHILPPEGSRIPVPDEDEVNELEEEDQSKYVIQLECIACCASKVPEYSISTLARLIDEKTMQLHQFYQHLESYENERIAICEDLHWLVMIANKVIALDYHPVDNNEIPKEILEYCRQRESLVNLDDSLRLLTLLNLTSFSESERKYLEETCDHVIWLISAVFRACHLETSMLEHKLAGYLSPTLSTTLLYFLQTVAQIYLLLKENEYNEVPRIITAAFSLGSNTAEWMINFMLNKIYVNLTLFNTDEKVTENTITLLDCLGRSRNKAAYIVKNPIFWRIIELNKNNEISSSGRSLMTAYTRMGIGMDKEHRYEYYNQVLQPLVENFRTTVCDENFNRTFHEERNRNSIFDTIDKLIGVLEGNTESLSEHLVCYIFPLLEDFANLISLYQNYQQVNRIIIEFFNTFVVKLLDFLSRDQVNAFYITAVNIVKTYARFNMNSLTSDKDKEDVIFEDLKLFIIMLKEIMFMKAFSKHGSLGDIDSEKLLTNVCVCGLHGLLPLMTVDLLRFPDLSENYFELLQFFCEMYPKEMCSQPRDFIVNILATVELGLTMSNTAHLCCKVILALISFVLRNDSFNNNVMHEILQPFFKIVLTLVLSRQMNLEYLSNFSDVLYILICCYQDYYMQLTEEFINSYSDVEIAQLLRTEFSRLISEMEFTHHNMDHKKSFLPRFESFINNTYGFLFIK